MTVWTNPDLEIRDADIVELFENVLQSPYANYLTRQFVLTSLTKLSSRPRTTGAQRERIATMLSGFVTSPELEIQQRSVEFASLFNQGEIFVGVLERMPAPELKATVIGIGEWGLFLYILYPPCLYICSERKQTCRITTDRCRCKLFIRYFEI